MCCLVVVSIAAALLGGYALAGPGNPVAVAASYHVTFVRRYTCGNWLFLRASRGVDYAYVGSTTPVVAVLYSVK